VCHSSPLGVPNEEVDEEVEREGMGMGVSGRFAALFFFTFNEPDDSLPIMAMFK
jgi:hypothetical protein